MPQYLSPGVYIEELDADPHPIQGVSTSTTGMVGVTVRRPTDGKPQLVTTFNDYQRIFGGFRPALGAGLARQWESPSNLEGGAWQRFPLAVKAFFDNGGQQLYVKRVFSAGDSGADNGAKAASGSPVRGLVAEVTKDAAAGATTLSLRHLFGIQQGTRVTLVRGDTGQQIAQVTVSAYDGTLGAVTLGAALTQEVRAARGDVAQIAAPSLADAGKRAPDRHPGDGRHRRDRDLRRARHVVTDRAGRPRRPLRAAQGPLRDPRPPDGLDIGGIGAFRQAFDTEYAALYYPWCITVDPSTSGNVHVPPSGFLAGIYANTDVSRGVHKAPANVVIQGINLVGGLAADITKREQDVLNPVGINALRFFPGLGERVWGARTLSSVTNWTYINVRRLFIYVEKSIFNGTQWVVFEPNNEQLWALVRQSISAFLTTVWQTGALAGTTQDQAFFVQCDRTTMTQDDLDNGRLICIIGLAPVYPAEFVIFRFEQKTASGQQS